MAHEIAEESLRRQLALLLSLLCLLRLHISRRYRIYVKRYEALTQLSGKTADLLTEISVPQRASDKPAQRTSNVAHEIAKESLRSQLPLLLLCLLLSLLSLLQLLDLLRLHIRRSHRVCIERYEALAQLLD